MTITFTFCPSLHTVPLSYPTIPSNISTEPEYTNHDDFFRDLFESNYQILGFQTVVLVITFLLILPMTFYFIEVTRVCTAGALHLPCPLQNAGIE